MTRTEFQIIWKALKASRAEEGFYIYDHWFVVPTAEESLAQALAAREDICKKSFHRIRARVCPSPLTFSGG